MLCQTYRLISSSEVQSNGVSPATFEVGSSRDEELNCWEAVDSGCLVEGGGKGIRTLSKGGESNVALVN